MKVLAFLAIGAVLSAQALDPEILKKPLGSDWPTYSGDYSGKRYSSLTQINTSNVKNLSLAWVTRVQAGPGGPAVGRGAGAGYPTIVGGEGDEALAASFVGNTNIRASPLIVDGRLYF